MALDATDPVALLTMLVKCPSVTPVEGGALEGLQEVLEAIGCDCTRLVFSAKNTPDVDNLFARIGTGAPHFCFAGHTDVVPVGSAEDWSHPPFSAAIEDGFLYGRGASDMKGGIACFIAALKRFLDDRPGEFKGSISLLITGDEEGPAVSGTVKVLEWMAANNHAPNHCIVGEPTSVERVGDMIKIGRRGSTNVTLVVDGIQGHVAYPLKARNPFDLMLRILTRLNAEQLDSGNAHFQPSNLEITAIDTNNPATNVIPARTQARFNIRYNDTYNEETIAAHITQICLDVAGAQGDEIQLEFDCSGDSFLTQPDEFVQMVTSVITARTGLDPELSTGGGTSDARFITKLCPVIEFGAVAENIHGVDERANIDNLETVTQIYQETLEQYFS